MVHPTFETAKGLGGLGAMILAQLTSFQTDLEWGLRVLSLVLGIVVAVLTIRSMRKTRRGRD